MPLETSALWTQSKRAVDARPWLVCMGLRSGPLVRRMPDEDLYLANAARCLDHARLHHWRVVHIATRAPQSHSDRLGAVCAGLEPARDEARAIKSGPSLFTSHLFLEHAMRIGAVQIHVIGVAPLIDCIATAIDARHLGWPASFVEDALATPNLSDLGADETRRLLARLVGSVSALASTALTLSLGEHHE